MGNGFTKINRIDKVSNVGAYVSKYLSKDKIDERFTAEKCYFCSRLLEKPVTIKDDLIVNQVLESVSGLKAVCEFTFENDYIGLGRYRQFVLSET